tara:strand:+ start:12 stop:176 length:165 start_codon:yes stop_codon:yes gene_type:complete
MKKIFECRRSSLALIGMVILGIGLYFGKDTSDAIAAVCIGVAASNGIEKGIKGK